MYFTDIGKLVSFTIGSNEIRRFRVNRASPADAQWLRETLNREGKEFGTATNVNTEGNVFTLIFQF